MSWLTCWETSGFIDLQKVLSSFQANPAVSLLEQIASRLLRAFTVSDVCGVFCVAFCFVCFVSVKVQINQDVFYEKSQMDQI